MPSAAAFAGSAAVHNEFAELSLEELLEVVVVSSSTYEQKALQAHANIIVISAEQIERRGYRNLVDVLQDVPGFDFATFGDGGGEYPSHSSQRGIGGDPGNTRLLVMVDGVVQNHIAFNWSAGWGNEQMLHDLDRIEIIQGPGSALYGTNAFSGIVHLITRKDYQGAEMRVAVGEYEERDLQILAGKRFGDLHLQLAARLFESDGDGGKDRPDPQGYFHGNRLPDRLTEDFSADGDYLTDVENPYAGEPLADGFRTASDDLALRLRLGFGDFEWGGYYWDKREGLGSYTVGYEYHLNDDHPAAVHHRGYDLYGKHTWQLDERVALYSTLVHRRYRQLDDTDFVYTYRFPDFAKSYHSDSRQWSLEERIDFTQDAANRWVGGVRLQRSWKMDQQVELRPLAAADTTFTGSTCWDRREEGWGARCAEDESRVDELAAYLQWNGEVAEGLSHSLGVRYDRSDEFDPQWTPRAGLVYTPGPRWTFKALYGTAFRQPGVFELTDEFRGNASLDPEEIATYELMAIVQPSEVVGFTASLYHSDLSDLIELTADATSEAGERYMNRVERLRINGAELGVNFLPSAEWTLFANYAYTKVCCAAAWGAPHKLNLGVNWQPRGSGVNVNLRANLVGRRETPASNARFHGEDAPGYAKVDLALTHARTFGVSGLDLRLLVDNLFDQSYYGIGRQAGSSDVDAWDPVFEPNPDGFIPPYHPQPGRRISLGMRYRF